MKKQIVLAVVISAISLLSLVSVNAVPVWDTFGMYPWVNFHVLGTGVHIASDPLFDSATIGDFPPFDPSAADYVKGWVTFPCSSDKPLGENLLTGFHFSITVKDVPKGTYEVWAEPTWGTPPPPAPPVSYPSDDLGEGPYLLGTFRITGNRARGGLKGFWDMDAGDYVWKITVKLDGTPIAETHFADPIDFLVIS